MNELSFLVPYVPGFMALFIGAAIFDLKRDMETLSAILIVSGFVTNLLILLTNAFTLSC